MEYDIIANILIDMNYPIHKRFSRIMEGIGYANYSDITWGKLEGGLSVTKAKTLLTAGLTTIVTGGLTTQIGNTFNANLMGDTVNTVTPITIGVNPTIAIDVLTESYNALG